MNRPVTISGSDHHLRAIGFLLTIGSVDLIEAPAIFPSPQLPRFHCERCYQGCYLNSGANRFSDPA